MACTTASQVKRSRLLVVCHASSRLVSQGTVLGPILGWVLKRIFGGTKWFSREATDRALQMGTIAVGAALLSHLAADILSAPDISTRIEPLWPLVQGPIAYVDVLYYDSVWATWGLFAVGLALNAALYYVVTQRRSSRRTQPS